MNAIDLIKAAESCRLEAYDDATGLPVPLGGICSGKLTIGWGSTSNVSPGEKISQKEADDRLNLESGIAAADALALVGPAKWSVLDPARKAALIDMAYELGRAKLNGFHEMLWAVQRGAWKEAYAEALNSLWAKQVPSRAKRDATMLLTGEWPKAAEPGA